MPHDVCALLRSDEVSHHVQSSVRAEACKPRGPPQVALLDVVDVLDGVVGGSVGPEHEKATPNVGQKGGRARRIVELGPIHHDNLAWDELGDEEVYQPPSARRHRESSFLGLQQVEVGWGSRGGVG